MARVTIGHLAGPEIHPPHSRSRIAELLKHIHGDVEFTPAILRREDLAPPKPRFLVQYHGASVDEARARVPLYEEAEDVIYQYEDDDEEKEDHQVRNNEQVHNVAAAINGAGWAGLLSTSGSRLSRAAGMDGRERESGEPPVTGDDERDRGGCGAVRRWVTLGTIPRLVCQIGKDRRLHVALCEI
jgi:hypothetical protein